MQPDTPAADRPPLDLDAIRARHHKAMTTIADIIRYGDSASVSDAAMLAVSQSAADVPALEDEVTALRAELDKAEAKELELQVELSGWDEENTRLHAELDKAHHVLGETAIERNDLRAELDAARAERREALDGAPTSNNDENTRLNDAVVFLKSVAGDAQGASDEWFAAQVRRMRDLFGFSPAARAEQTEPATGEDDGWGRVIDAKRRLFARIIANANRLDTPFTNSPLSPWDLLKRDMERLEVVLAALDLPGRERALREERNQARSAVESYEELYERCAAERDAANAALADVARLLDEARMERDRLRVISDAFHEAIHAVRELLGDDTEGEGLAGEIRLLGHQRDTARASVMRLLNMAWDHINDCPEGCAEELDAIARQYAGGEGGAGS